MSKFCPKCGTQLSDEASLCAACGTTITAPTTLQQPVESQTQPNTAEYNPASNYSEGDLSETVQPPKKKSKTKIILISVIAAVVLIGAIVGILLATGVSNDKGAVEDTNTPEYVAKAFMKEVCEGDGEGALEYFASFMNEMWLISFGKDYPERFAGYEPSIKVVKVEEWPEDECETMKEMYSYIYDLETDPLQVADVELELSFKGEGAPRNYIFILTMVKYDENWEVSYFGEKE